MDPAILEELSQLGFSEHEARVFVALTTRSAAVTAYQLAKMAQLPVANTYNVIRSLERRGACRKVQDNPAQYVAADAREFLARIADETVRACTSLVDKLQNISPTPEARYVDVLAEEEEVENRIIQMIDGAQKLIVMKFPGPLKKYVERALSKAIRRRVTCYIIYYGEKPNLPDAPTVHLWPHEGNGVDMGGDFCMLTADLSEAIAFNAQTYSAAYSQNEVFVYLTDVLLRHEIYLSEVMLKFGNEIETAFGPALYKLREVFARAPLSEQTGTYIKWRSKELGL